jgi:cytochrome c peroxidase
MTSGLRRFWNVALMVGLVVAASGSQEQASPATPPPALTVEVLDGMTRFPGGLAALPEPPEPRDNPLTRPKIRLGRVLFQDRRLSRDYSMSCASCHDPDKGFSDGKSRAIGIGQKVLPRRSPSLFNAAYNPLQFWDGRAHSLEDQARQPILSATEMGIPDQKTLLGRLHGVAEYRQGFQRAFGREMNFEDVMRAIAAFERTLVIRDSAFDRYVLGDKNALTVQQKRGLILFIGKAACTECHNGPNFTDNKFYSLGLLPGESEADDLGRFAITRNPADRHAFKTPSLRGVTLRSPYMHDGSIATLSEVIDFYDQGGGAGPKSALVFKLQLTASEKEDLTAFLQSLAGCRPTNNIYEGGDER